MNLGFYFLDLSVALIAIGAFLHISKCDREHVTRAEFDKHLAEMRVELERLGASRRDVVPPAANVNHVDAGLSAVPDLHNGNGPDADVGDDDAPARSLGVAEIAGHFACGDAEAHANAPTVCPDSVANDGVDEVGERNDCAKRYKDGGFCFHGEYFTKSTAERNDR